MKQCGRCGTQNLDQQTACTGCGLALPAAPATGFGGTMVMEPTPPPAGEAPKPAEPPKANLRGTMIGLAPPSPQPAGPAPAAGTTPPAPSQPPPASASQPPARHFGAT